MYILYFVIHEMLELQCFFPFIFDVERSLCNFQTGCIYLAYKANTCLLLILFISV